jgi:ribosomal protein S18 acetylase RimI-like enzyme
MEKPVTIRKAIISDLSDITTISIECFGEIGTLSDGLMTKMIISNISYVVCYEEQIIGFLLCSCKNKILNLSVLAINEQFRGKGLGRRLIKLCLEDNKTTEVNTFTLHVDVRNTVAKGLYDSLGFLTRKVIEGYYEDGADAYFMTLNVKEESVGENQCNEDYDIKI